MFECCKTDEQELVVPSERKEDDVVITDKSGKIYYKITIRKQSKIENLNVGK